ncbi:MAG: ImmA/IrrE family metallo-endopeptidase, partial [Chloroflexota bacterium]|nr:ImmA/IrrE family metallo-endopeptidase [Chloroflexota bacterium]
FLLFEHENVVKCDDPAFAYRHSLGTAADGYAVPDLTVVASGARTQLRWAPQPQPWTRVKFLNSGSAIVDRGQFRQDCADFVDTVIRRLLAHGIGSTFLQDEWTAIQAADDEEASFCEMSAGLGWDPYDLDDDSRDRVISLSEQLGDLSEEAVPVIDSADPSKDCSAILAAIRAAKPNVLLTDDSLPSFIPHQSTAERPWEGGYRLAREARSEFGLDGLPIPDTESLASALNQSLATLRRATEPVAALDGLQLVDGVVTRGASGGMSLGLKARGETGMRFLLCRALCEAISSHQDSLVTRGTTQRQQRNRAFAAEFLAPARSLRERITHPIVDAEQVDDIAEEFGVSTQVILNQIENHRIAQFSAI